MVNCFSCITIIFAHQMASTPFINIFGVVFNNGKTHEKCVLNLGFMNWIKFSTHSQIVLDG